MIRFTVKKAKLKESKREEIEKYNSSGKIDFSHIKDDSGYSKEEYESMSIPVPQDLLDKINQMEKSGMILSKDDYDTIDRSIYIEDVDNIKLVTGLYDGGAELLYTTQDDFITINVEESAEEVYKKIKEYKTNKTKLNGSTKQQQQRKKELLWNSLWKAFYKSKRSK